ncbi:RNA 2',3'-cyclic phosphodiesterase [Cellulomonas sp. Y8]|uniref:RNA 2',3'-cyclic phosphodiesterase n=1 Tax=Cellulomonas sp. Y8 TaxID=2591145 RepID=UPI003D729DA3
MRVFAALWPTDEPRRHLASALRTAVGVDAEHAPGRSPDGVRWTPAENWHVTLAFYGEVGEGRAELLAEHLAGVAADGRPFDLELAGAGVFAHRTLWAGVGGDVAAVQDLVAGCRDAGDAVGARQDDRVRSRPHVTLGRVSPQRGGNRRRDRASRAPDPGDLLVHALAVYRGPRWSVTELVLAESLPGEGRAGGPLYRPLGAWPLGGTAPPAP